MAFLLTFAAGVSLLLAMIGTYSMISNSVVERTREFGIRMALGASIGQTVRISAASGILCGAAGLLIGVAAARIGTRVFQGLLYGITPVDTATYVFVGVGVLIVVSLASFIPALRIARLDPAQTLRHE